ncbi:MAG TPA: AsmA-like C-terminal region-containing protein, partial [Motiliproteus sp.]
WRFDGQQHRTDLLFNASAEDLGDVMEGVGSARSMETEGFDATAILGWPGTPLGFAWSALNGSLEVQARRGRILDTGERPVLKLFSLLNMRTLLRRLSFDFADLTAEGLFFDRIDGLLGMHNGVAQTLRTATLLSPTHDIDLEGQVDLGRELVDMELLVKLPVSENLPIAAALLAAPPVAGMVFLVERLIGDSLKRFTSVRYRLSGPWSDPQMEPLRKPPAPTDAARPLPDTAH